MKVDKHRVHSSQGETLPIETAPIVVVWVGMCDDLFPMKVGRDRAHSGQGKTPPLETALIVVVWVGMCNEPDCKGSFVWIQYTISRLLISI